MWTLFDTIGSSIVGASIMLLVFALILQMNSISGQIEGNNLIQSHYTATMDVLSYDLYKIGFEAEGEKILLANAENIKYCTDLKNDGSVDTVSYSVSTTSDSIGNTIYVYRKLNSGVKKNIGVVSDFNLSYFDSLGNTINYSDLSLASFRKKIRSIEIKLEMTVEQEDNTGFRDLNWRVRIKPKNLLSRN
jgi:hypothetical protein